MLLRKSLVLTGACLFKGLGYDILREVKAAFI